MPLISAKCTNCGANLEVDNTKDAAVCPYCNTAYVVEKAVNYYNTTNNINANVVNVYGGNSADFVIRAGELVKYNGASTEVCIPNTVKIIGHEAFCRCYGLEKITIPDSVTEIHDHAFQSCTGLTEIIIPDSVTVIVRAFEDCQSLQKVTLSKKLRDIGDSAFKNCKALGTVNIPDSVQKIGKRAFDGCEKLSSVHLGQGVRVIEGGAFASCTSLREIVFPKSVESIAGDDDGYVLGAFSGCKSLQKVAVLGNTKIWSPKAFRDCPVQIVEASIEWKKSNYKLFNCLASYAPSSTTQTSSGCYIATAVYGSYDCPQVWTLRRFRDNTLAATWYGRAFIRFYYTVSPTLVKLFGHMNWFKKLWRRRLDDMVEKLQLRGVESSPYCDREW